MKKYLILSLAIIMAIILLAACGSSDKNDTGTTATSGEFTGFDPPVTLKIYGQTLGATAFPPGVQDDPIAQYIKENLGIIMHVDSTMTIERYAAMYASGDMGDFMWAQPAVQGELIRSTVQRLQESGLVLDLRPLVESSAPNIQKLQKQMDFWTDQFGYDTGGFFMTCGDIAPESSPNPTLGIVLHYGFWEGIGAPKINSAESWLDAVEEMVKSNPTNQYGQQRFGFAYFPEWGAKTQPWHLSQILAAFDNVGLATDYGNAYYFPYEGRVADMYAPDSYMWEAFRFYNQAYQRGILDPDYMTNTWDTIIEKSTADRILSNLWTWSYGTINAELADQATGYHTIPIDTDYFLLPHSISPFGTDYLAYIIPASSTNPEAAMRLMDFFFSELGSRMIMYGVPDVHWEIRDDGEIDRTQYMFDLIADGTDIGTVTGAGKYWNLHGLAGTFIGSDGRPLGITVFDPADFNPFQRHIAEMWNIDHPDWTNSLVKNNALDVTFNSLLMPLPPDLTEIFNDVGAYSDIELVKLVGAASDAEFEAIKTAFIDKINSMGWQQVWAFIEADFNKVIAELSGF